MTRAGIAASVLATGLLAWLATPAAEQATARARPTAPASALRIATNLDVSKVERALAAFERAERRENVDVEPLDARALKARLTQKDRPVDVVIIEGVGYLEDAFDAGAIVRFESAAMHQAIPYEMRSRARGWFAVSYVARGVVSTSAAKVPRTLANVWSLPATDRGTIRCLPAAGHVRARVAVADAIRDLGSRAEPAVAEWVAAAAKAGAPRSERELIQSVAAGRCTMGLAYSDAIAEARTATAQLRFNVSWPTGGGDGASILATGVAMTSHHEHYDRVLRLLEWLVSDDGQRAWTTATLTFPGSEFVRAPEAVRALGAFPVDLNRPFSPVGLLNEAEQLSIRVGYR